MNYRQAMSERDTALSKLNMTWARQNVPLRSPFNGSPATETVLLAAMHKARYEILHMLDKLRHESRAWLEQNGFGRRGGLPWPIKGVLPN